MKSKPFRAFIVVFVFMLVFAFTMALYAGGPPPTACCIFYNQCGYMGSGSMQNHVCSCCIPDGGTGCFQGFYEGCWYICPADCPLP
jgi:hypothetical protein